MNEKGRTVEGDRIAKKHTQRLGENPALRNAPLLTKLMAATVVFDAESELDELITIEGPGFLTNT